jgi:hypothetical protein
MKLKIMGSRKMKTLFVILSLFLLSVSLFADDSCFVNVTLTGTITGSVTEPITANVSGNVTNKNGNIISAAVTGQVTGTIIGIILGTITATIIDTATGSISSIFTGIGTGVICTDNNSELITANIGGNVVDNITCINIKFEDCGSSMECPVGVKYLYYFCVDGEITTVCTDDPLKYENINSNIFAIKANLPLFTFLADEATYEYEYFSKYRNGEDDDIVLFEEEDDFMNLYEKMLEELDLACNK